MSEPLGDEWLDLDDLIDKVRELIEIGLLDEALELLDRYQSVFPNEPDLCQLYAQIYAERDEPERAIPCLEHGLAVDKDNTDCLLGMFYAYSQMGDLKKGFKYLQQAEKLEPASEAVLGSMIWYYNELERFDIAIQYFEKARAAGVENPETLRNAGIAYQRMRRPEEAETCLRAALDLNPQFDEARDLLADLHLMRNKPDQAAAIYREHLRNSPNHIRSLSRLVFCLCQNEKYDEATEEARRTINFYPNSSVGYVDLAFVYLNQNRFSDALEEVSKALDISPLDGEAYRLRGILFSEIEKPEEAEKNFEHALSLDPDNPEIQRDFYHHLQNFEQFERMEQIVRGVIKQEYPYCVEDYWFLAEYYRSRGQNLRAFHNLRKAYKLVPGESELMPPMIDILIDEGHVSFTYPMFARYVGQSGWNDVMERYSRNRRLKGKRTQEGLRLLRFLGERNPEFRRFLHGYYLFRFVRMAGIALAGGAFVFAGFFFGVAGVLFMLAVVGGFLGGWLGVRYGKRRLSRKIAKTATG